MKHFYTSFMLLFAALFCSAQVVTDRPEGTMKYYQRTGGLTYLNDGQQLHLQNQSGFTEIVYSADGTKAWVKNPVAGFFPEDSEECAWVEGRLTDNGSTIEVPVGQKVYFGAEQNDYVEIAIVDRDKSSHTTNFIYNATEAAVIYKIEGDKVSVTGTSRDRLLGLVWSSDRSWLGFGDYESVYTIYDLPEPVTPPAGMTVKTYPLSAIEYMNEQDAVYSTEVNVGFDGDDVYIQGFDKFIPMAWLKGRLNGSRVTFDVQYIGTDPADRRHFLAGWKGGAVGPVEINYYKDLDAFESTSPVMINSNPTMHNYYAYYRSMYIGERPDPIELPAGANPVRMVLKGKIDDTGLTARDFTRVVKLANVGDKVYIQGLSTDVPEGWAMGTLADGKLTIPRGQFMGFGEQAAIYLHGADAKTGEFRDIVFDYDEAANTYIHNHILYECTAREPRTYTWQYLPGLTIYYDPNAPTGADPDDLPATDYIFKAQCMSKIAALTGTSAELKVKIAVDGNLVYIKGLSPETPDAWIKGEMFDNTVTFASPQLLGDNGSYNIYFSGYDMLAYALNDWTLTYNPADGSYKTSAHAVINRSVDRVNYDIWYYNMSFVKDPAGVADIAVDNADGEAVYYNLQGVRVDNPDCGVYVKVCGGKAEKVLVK